MTTMTAKGSGKIENIKVLVRVRPPSEAELSHGGYRKAVHATEDALTTVAVPLLASF